jgi:hypothetical protein
MLPYIPSDREYQNWVSLDQKQQPFVINNLHVNYVIVERMDKTIRAYPSLDAMKADEYRDWQERPAHERMRAVKEITLAMYHRHLPDEGTGRRCSTTSKNSCPSSTPARLR